ncbi:BQ2448_3440 [Microbotryum intermedium]|uniref:BQ2448_3440 protein n=1 Tax=Microbotryum intermedium TaxID=269621 RepID=A0A238FHN9_9BASI|nr:BQ2448_3440 [Microbotryum intermedium]
MTSSSATPSSDSASTSAPLTPNPPIESVRYDEPNKLPADLLEWPSTDRSTASTPPSTILLFIPGNPGLVHYYTSFLSTLHRNLDQSKSVVYALGHLDHSNHAKARFTSRGVPGLREQIAHKVAFIDELASTYPQIGVEKGAKTKLVLVAHSIGSYISCECIKARPSLVSSAILLFPTISHMALTPNGRRLWPLFSPLGLAPVGLSTALLSYLPRESLSRVVGRLSGQSGPGSLVTTGLVTSPGSVVAALTMAKEEMRNVTELDGEMLKKYGNRLCWYWARGDDDGWVLPSSVKEIEDVLDQAGFPKERRKKCEEGMQHAFILTTKHSDSLAIRCAAWVTDHIRREDV